MLTVFWCHRHRTTVCPVFSGGGGSLFSPHTRVATAANMVWLFRREPSSISLGGRLLFLLHPGWWGRTVLVGGKQDRLAVKSCQYSSISVTVPQVQSQLTLRRLHAVTLLQLHQDGPRLKCWARLCTINREGIQKNQCATLHPLIEKRFKNTNASDWPHL